MSANKNYNVDDILSEIKSRKLREKAEASSGVSRDDEFHLDFSPREPIAEPEPRPEPEQIQKPEPRPGPRSRRPDPEPERRRPAPDDFEFKTPEPVAEKPRNPLEFSGEARSITDKAKLRGKRSPLQKFELNAEPDFNFKPDFDLEPDFESGLDFEQESDLAFDAFDGAEERFAGDSSGQTLVLPDMTGMRDHPVYNPETMTGMRDNSVYKPKAGDVRKKEFGKFTLDVPDDLYYDDAPGDDLPEGSVVDYSEYNSTSDRRDVQRDIAHVKLWLFIRVSLTFILTAILFVVTFSAKYQEIPLPEFMLPEEAGTVRAYFIVCTALAILVALVNSSAVGGGLMGLFKMHSNSDTLAACAIIAAVGQGIAVVADPSVAVPEALSLYYSVAALAMLFNALGKMTMINRILSNFRIIASDKPKKSVFAVDSDEFCREFFKDTSRRPVVAYSAGADFFTDFLGLSYSDKYDVGINRAVAPVCLCGSLLVGGITYLLTGNSFSAISALTAILCVSATLSSTFIENVPLSKLAKKLTPQGGMVSGNKAVEDFCDTKAVVLTENDLFPRGNVSLHGIKAFSQSRIDEAILDAASVLCAMDGALGPVFLDMVGGNKKLLKKADNITFENAMGVSAWVDQRRVLIGNRRLMKNHGIALPPEALRQNQLTGEAEPLFLSNSGEATAMFTVGYNIDEELAGELDRLAHHGSLLIVHTTDANITADKIHEIYGYPIELIRVLPAEWHARYQKMSESRDKAVAEIVYTGKAPTLLRALLACVSARASILSATIIQLIQIVLGYSLLTFMAFMGSISSVGVAGICAYQLFWFAAIFIVQKIRQI